MLPTGFRRPAADKTQTTYIGIEAWGRGVFQEMRLMESWGGRWPALEAVRQTGEHTRRQGQIKEMGGGLFPASPYGLVSWAKVNRR